MFTSALVRLIRRKFPDTPDISTDDLQLWLEDAAIAEAEEREVDGEKPVKPILLDARSTPEFGVSRIAACADHLPFDADDAAVAEKVRGIKDDNPGRKIAVVAYCSIGYRSAILTDRIRALELEDVEAYNLEGSIFKWVNEGKPVVDASGEPTTFVHPYNRLFGWAVDRSRWRFEQ